jgi:hypothetical protein
MEELKIVLGIFAFLFVAFAAASEAVMDKVQFHYNKSIFKDAKYKQIFWDPNLSWVNKWKDSSAREEKFAGSSTIFVFTTDAWHLFKFYRNTALFIGLPLLFLNPINIVWTMIIARVVYGLVFTLFFDKILKSE